MTSLSSTCARWAALGLLGFLLVQACSTSTTDSVGPVARGGAGGFGGVGGGKVYSPDVMVPPADGGMPGFNPLCGVDVQGGCVPDDDRSCSGHVPLEPQSLDFLVAGAAGSAGQGGGAGASSRGGEAGAGGAGGSGLSGGGMTSGADAGAGGVPGEPAYACRVIHSAEQVLSRCARTGRGQVNAPCFDGADCGAGLGCVKDGTVSRCRPYCCAGDGSCSGFVGSYCAERELKESPSGATADPVWVPVCVPADNCDLSEPYPCPRGRKCQCAAGTACMVVRPEGTTACTEPGMGQLGEACPCAPGFVCSRGTALATCLELCRAGDEGDAGLACPKGRCQSSAELPAGWGICVGG